MIQRVQSFYLLLTVLLSVLLFFLPISSKIIPANASTNTTEISYKVKLTGVEKYEGGKLVSMDSKPALLIINLATGLLSLIIIFLFKNRKLQMKLCRLCVLFCGCFLVLGFYFSDSMGRVEGPDIKPMYLSGSYFPILQIVLLVMALRAIRKDDDLVQSADRIR